MKTTPNSELATRLASLLVEQGLLTPASQERIAERIATGKMRQEDWRLEIEKVQDRGNSQ